MQVFNNEVYVQQGEHFSLDFSFRNKDGSPFLISNKLLKGGKVAYILVTISNELYNQKQRYVYNKWLTLSEIVNGIPVAFYCTKPVVLSKSASDTQIPGDLPADVQQDCKEHNDSNYTTYAIYKANDNTGKTSFYYYDSSTNILVEYPFELTRISFTVMSNITKDWVVGNYTYGIQLVSGEPNTSKDENAKPINVVDQVQALLPPTRLIVTSNVDNSLGGLQWQK